MLKLSLLGALELSTREHYDGQDDTEETKGGSENLDDQELDEQGGVGSIGQGSTGTSDTDGDTVREEGGCDRRAAEGVQMEKFLSVYRSPA